MNRHRIAAILVLTLACAAVLRADPPTRPSSTQPATISLAQSPYFPSDSKTSIVEHSITIDGKKLEYRSCAGTVPIADESGRVLAEMFYVAYVRMPVAPARDRPITFVFNGGPGAAAVWLHLGAAGPMRLALDANGDPPRAPYNLEENPNTWLKNTDLVFIDPIGTGYSRAAAGIDPKQFYGVAQDVHSVASFIRTYLTQSRRWLSPKFLAGESYGTTRAAALSNYLLEQEGISVDGIILISSVLDFQMLDPSQGNDLPYALYLPSYAAIAWYHKKLPADLQADLYATLHEVEQWTMGPYLTALARGESLDADTEADVVKHLARYTGLPESYVRKAHLRIDPSRFRQQLLLDQEEVLGRFDARVTGHDSDPPNDAAAYDPSLARFVSAYTATINEYARNDLNYQSDVKYEVLTGRVQPWDFGRSGGGYLYVADDLQAAMQKNPRMKVLFANGYFDLATPYLTTDYTIDHMHLGAALRKNIVREFYDSGHMVYHPRKSQAKLAADVSAFIESCRGD